MDCYCYGVRFCLPLLVATLCGAALSGCCVLDGTCLVEAGDAGAPPPQNDVVSLDSRGCDSADIRADGDDTCATCSFGQADAADSEICGAVVEAPCEIRENASGEACQLCVTDDGDILFDDCFAGSNAGQENVSCEQSEGQNDAEACTSCFDDVGNVTSIECGPTFDSCEDSVDDAGRVCTTCTSDGVVVSQRCDGGNLDPAVCYLYGDDDGSCVDCYDVEDRLLSHACTPAAGPGSFVCEQVFTPEGLSCTVCVDENGTPFGRQCEQPTPTRCEQLAYTEQTCVVCLDDANTVVAVDCVRNQCAAGAPEADVCRSDADCSAGFVCFDGACVAQQGSDPGEGEEDVAPAPPPGCEPPPACESFFNADGELCRACPVEASGGTETLCVSALPTLTCDVVSEATLAPDDDGEDGFREPKGRSCVVCSDSRSGVEVYRDCEGNGSVPPPYCVDEARADGDSCSVCYDAVDNDAVYTSCPDETCFDLERSLLLAQDGTPLTVDADEAAATCKQCGDTAADGVNAGEAEFSSACFVENVCAVDPYGADVTGCPATQTLTLAPRACENPWEPWRTSDSDVGTLRAILSHGLEAGGFAAAGARVVVDASIGACPSLNDSSSCDCDSGQRIELAVVEADVAAARAIYGGLLAP